MPESKYPIRPLDFEGISTYPIRDRRSKVNVSLFGRPAAADDDIGEFVGKLPRILGAESLQKLIAALREARASGRAIIWGMGGHVIKCGLSPIVIDMMRDGFITGIATSGAAAIHDFEVALTGSTSEDVETELGSGRFGMAQETGEYMNAAINAGVGDGIGLGESLGRFVDVNTEAIGFQHADLSVLREAYASSIPVTIHLAIGTDITHMHPSASGEKLGQGTMRDFKLLCSMTRQIHNGGVYVNLGSAVILPEAGSNRSTDGPVTSC